VPFEPATISQLRDSLRDELDSYLSGAVDGEYVVASRYLPRTRRENLSNLQVTVYIAATDPDMFASGREGDEDDHTIEIAFQQAVPCSPNPDNGRPDFDQIDQPVFLDSIIALVESVKSLWRPETQLQDAGQLRNKKLAGCTFIGLKHDPVFEPEPLIGLGVISVVLSVTYRIGF
jgi:hypothetical protein